MSNSEIKTSHERRATSDRKVAWWYWHRRLYDWVIHWADTRYGVLALIILAISEPVCVPIPADIMVIGLCLGKPKCSLRYGFLCSFVSVLGGTIAFSLGLAIGGERVIHFCEWISPFFAQLTFGLLNPDLGELAHKALEIYQEYDFWAIAIAALTPVPYLLFSWLGGMASVSIVKFILVSIVFRTMRFGSEGILFYFLGERARRLIEKYFNIATVIVIILLVLLAYIMKKLGHIFMG
jgi:membrane protein YqaA with SNARE-associated domain